MTGIAFASPPPRTAERDGACFRHRRVGRGAAGYRCPTTSRNERPLLPHIDLLEFDQICGGFGTVPKLIDTDGSKRGQDCGGGRLLRHLLGGFSRCPPAPGEADDGRCYKSDEGPSKRRKIEFPCRIGGNCMVVPFTPHGSERGEMDSGRLKELKARSPCDSGSIAARMRLPEAGSLYRINTRE